MNYGNNSQQQHLQQQQQQYYQSSQQGGVPRFPPQAGHGITMQQQQHPSLAPNFQMHQSQQHPSGVLIPQQMQPQQQQFSGQAPAAGGYTTFTDDQRRSILNQLPAQLRNQVLSEKDLARQDHFLHSIILTSRNRALERQRQIQQISRTTPPQQQQLPQQQAGQPSQLQQQLGHVQAAPNIAHPMQYAVGQQQPLSVESHQGMQRVAVQPTQFRHTHMGQQYVVGGGAAPGMSALTSSASQHNSPMSIPSGGPQSVGPMAMAAVQQQPRSIPPAVGASPQALLSNSTGGPASVINTMRSVPSVPPPQSHYNAQSVAASAADANSPEYVATLIRLREYHDPCRRLISRLEVDVDYQRKLKTENPQDTKLLTSVKRVLEIMEGKRVVDIKLVERLINNVRSSLTSNNPMKGLIDVARKLAICDSIPPIKAAMPDPWSSLRHLEIRLPASIVNRLKEEGANGGTAPSKAPPKRLALSDANGADTTGNDAVQSAVEPTQKRTKIGDAHMGSTEKGSAEQQVGTGGEADLRSIAALNRTLSDELRSLKLRCCLDSDHLPVTRENCSSIPLVIENAAKTSTTIALRLLVPFDYPKSGVRVPPPSTNSTAPGQKLPTEELRSRLDCDDALAKNIPRVIETWTRLTDTHRNAAPL